MLFVCYLVATLEDETEFERESNNKVKYIVLTLRFSINSSRNFNQKT